VTNLIEVIEMTTQNTQQNSHEERAVRYAQECISMLSDVQEQILFDPKHANETINFVKKHLILVSYELGIDFWSTSGMRFDWQAGEPFETRTACPHCSMGYDTQEVQSHLDHELECRRRVLEPSPWLGLSRPVKAGDWVHGLWCQCPLCEADRSAVPSTSGTSLQGSVFTTYEHLVATFGEPTIIDGDKTRAEWILSLQGETVTIYDWKTDSLPLEGYDWHVGGHNLNAPALVVAALSEYGIDRPTPEA
jgi:hypothetical protein